MSNKIRNKILFMTGHEKYHDFDKITEMIHDFLMKAGYEITHTQDPEMYHWYNIRDFDVILDITIHSYLSDECEKGLLDSIIGHPWGNTCEPKGFIGIHGAACTYLNSSNYLNMIGGSLLTHPEIQEYQFRVENKNHPIMQGVEDFRLKTELFLLKEHSSYETLLTCEYLGFKRPVVWCKPYGQGRVFYCALGHTVDDLENEQVQKIIINAVKWSVYKGDATFPYL
ncbi:MAG: ThuA domain-containing protein [Spirochaetales bacterium]|nr:ThuA domain-containing protein [Spirochaetales bacterium]